MKFDEYLKNVIMHKILQKYQHGAKELKSRFHDSGVLCVSVFFCESLCFVFLTVRLDLGHRTYKQGFSFTDPRSYKP